MSFTDYRKEGDKDYRTPANRQDMGEAMRYLFDLSGKRIAPPEVDMDTIKPVYDMGAGGFLLYELQYAATSFDPNGQNAPSTKIVSPSGSLTSVILTNKQRSQDNIAGPLVGKVLDWETRLLSMETTLTLSGAQATALTGKIIDVFLFMDPIVGALGSTVNIGFWKSAFQILTGVTSYKWGLYGTSGLPSQNVQFGNGLPSWDRWIPAKQRLTSQLVLQDGSNFGAGNTFSVTMSGILVPQGCQLPR